MRGSRPLSESEITAVLNSFNGTYRHRNKLIFLLGIKSGFRISEILSIRVGDIIQHGQIVERLTVRRRNMKKRIEGRTVLLHPAVQQAALEWLQELRALDTVTDETFLFQSRKGRNQAISKTQAWRILNQSYSQNNMTGTLGTHSMRKTFANRIYEKLGHDLVKTQRALAHRNINSTVSYLSFKEEAIDEAILSL